MSWPICRIVASLSFKTVGMANVILVFFVEFVVSNFPYKAFPPENYCFFDRQTNDLFELLAYVGIHNQEPILTLRNRPYCNRPKCFKCRSRRRQSCRWRIHNGQCFAAISSIISAVTVPSSPRPSAEVYSEEALIPDKKPRPKWSRTGISLVSSSSLGKAFAVSCRDIGEDNRDKQSGRKLYLKSCFQLCLELLIYYASLFFRRDISPTIFEVYTSLLHKIRHPGPSNLRIT